MCRRFESAPIHCHIRDYGSHSFKKGRAHQKLTLGKCGYTKTEKAIQILTLLHWLFNFLAIILSSETGSMLGGMVRVFEGVMERICERISRFSIEIEEKLHMDLKKWVIYDSKQLLEMKT